MHEPIIIVFAVFPAVVLYRDIIMILCTLLIIKLAYLGAATPATAERSPPSVTRFVVFSCVKNQTKKKSEEYHSISTCRDNPKRTRSETRIMTISNPVEIDNILLSYTYIV